MKFGINEEKTLKDAFDQYVNGAEYPSDEELSKVELSEDFQNKMAKIINGEKDFKVHTFGKNLQWVASLLVVVALAASAFAVVTFAEPIKPTRRVKDIIEIYNRYMYETGGEYNYIYCLKYIPDGYKEAGGGGDGNYSLYRYENENGDVIEFYSYSEVPIPVIDRFANVHEEIDGGLYVVNTNNGESRYIISLYDHVFDIRATNLPRDEVLAMAKSISRLIIEGKGEQ